MFYVINLKTQLVEHEDKDFEQARQFILNVRSLYNNGEPPYGVTNPFIVANGAKERKRIVGY